MSDLLPDEYAFLSDSGRCTACGHLDALHNDHCCSFCTVPDCRCEWYKIVSPPAATS